MALLKNQLWDLTRLIRLACFSVSLLLILATAGKDVYAADIQMTWLPLSTAPVGEIGVMLNAEFDLRKIENDDVLIRRFTMRLGWTPVTFASTWIEGGVASLSIDNESSKLQGDFGTSAGFGATVISPDYDAYGLRPFASMRGRMFISRLSEDRLTVGGLSRSRRSRYEIWEGYSMLGFSGNIGNNLLSWGLSLRALSQIEERHSGSGDVSYTKERYRYESGVQLGAAISYLISMKSRFNTHIVLEVYREGVNVSLNVGQWGVL